MIKLAVRAGRGNIIPSQGVELDTRRTKKMKPQLMTSRRKRQKSLLVKIDSLGRQGHENCAEYFFHLDVFFFSSSGFTV